MKTQWIPRTKSELVYLLTAYWPLDKAWFRQCSKKQLYAIFYKSVYGAETS